MPLAPKINSEPPDFRRIAEVLPEVKGLRKLDFVNFRLKAKLSNELCFSCENTPEFRGVNLLVRCRVI